MGRIQTASFLSVIVFLGSYSSLSLSSPVRETFTEVQPDASQTVRNSTGLTVPPSKNFTEEDDWMQGLCRLTTVDPFVHNTVVQMLTVDKMTLIEYQLNFTNYTNNPLTINVAGAYDAKKWSRVTTAHGQTLLSLAFNYGVLSVMTLTLGTKTLHVELRDSPPGCMAAVSDQHKIDSVRRLLMRDFDADGPITTVDDGRICHEIIVDVSGKAKFRHSCCYKNSITGRIECTTDIGNIWLNLLYGMLTVVRFGLLCFGPSLFISAVENMSKDNVPYVVRLKAKLEKTVCFCHSETRLSETFLANRTRTLDLTTMKGFPKLRNQVRSTDVPLGTPVRVRFPQYDICVDYKRTLKENTVPVGLFQSIFSALCKCHIRFVGPFRECCKMNILYSKTRFIPWSRFFRKSAKILLILLVPTPFYLRLAIFYAFEYDSLLNRKRAIAIGGLEESFENSLIHYFLPTHSLFIAIYVAYAITALVLAFITRPGKEHRLKKVIVDSFRDLKRLDWTDTLGIVVANVIWPFKKFGMLGCVVGLVYWPIALPVTLIIATGYAIPTIYLFIRMAFHSKVASVVKGRRSHRKTYKVRIAIDQDIQRFNAENVLTRNSDPRDETPDDTESLGGIDYVKPKEHDKEPDEISKASTIIRYTSFSWRRALKYIFCAVMCIVTLAGVVIILSEVIGCLIEIIVFTIMGCIVNAGSLLRYVMLIVMVFVYCCDCFNNMSKKYLKMNKALFNEVKCRIKDLEKVTSLPSSLQENCGFKAQELNEQAAYEGSDDVAEKPANHWMINDLVLFVDSEDTPRIPKQLFDEVTQIRVAGVPGPVFRGHIEAFKQLTKIVLFIVFVFIVVLSFGAVYKISSTNQMLATLVGGFLPMILRTFLAPPAPDVELGTVSFKSKMDEVIKNFCQYWPIYDLPFELVPEGEEDDAQAEAAASEAEGPSDACEKAAAALECPSYNNNNGGCGGAPMMMYGEMGHVDEFGAGNQYMPSNSIPMTTYWHSIDVPDSPSAISMTDDRHRMVRIDEPESQDKVDIVIYLPQIDRQWLDEWSDYGANSQLNVNELVTT